MVIPFAHLAVMQKAGIGEAVQIAGVTAACSADARNSSLTNRHRPVNSGVGRALCKGRRG
jgi:hypothetical protein